MRTLARSPGFSIAAPLALSLGIGVNTAMYSIVHAVILRPLGVREPGRLVRVYESNPSRNQLAFSSSVPNYLSWREQARSRDLTASQGYAASLTRHDGPERLETLLFGISTRDPVTFLGDAVMLLLAALIACYAPARRAAGADPIAALRAD